MSLKTDASAPDHLREVLVVGGTGMLRPAVHDLLADGAHVVVVARRPERAATGTSADDRLTPVVADWTDPLGWRDAVRVALNGRVVYEALIWAHTPYDQAIHRNLAEVLAPTAVIVQLWGSANSDPRLSRPWPAECRPPRDYRRVVLGFADGPAGTRWLTDREISNGAFNALREPTAEQVVGRVEPWTEHP